VRQEDPDFLEYCYRRVWLAMGASEEHADVMAHCISYGDRFGKLTQGMGVFEISTMLASTGTMDMTSRPEMVESGKNWALWDGRASSGQWAFTLATDKAIEQAREHAMALAMVRDFNDAGAFGVYIQQAVAAGMMAMATNNSLPLVSPWGGMENVLSGAPFAAGVPGNEHPPIVTDVSMVDAHDGDISEAYYQKRPLRRGKVLVDPETGELTDDPSAFIQPMDEYGRVTDCLAPTVFNEPRTYALNVFTEMLSSFIVPGARLSPEILGPPAIWLERQDVALTAGGSVIVIDPSHWMDLDEVKGKVDRFASIAKAAKRRPGVDEIFLPGERGARRARAGGLVDILPAHWESFAKIAAREGLSIAGLKADWDKAKANPGSAVRDAP
jgi:LDH2 family malate/lactate/ureidoglycolate dehydrogenase